METTPAVATPVVAAPAVVTAEANKVTFAPPAARELGTVGSWMHWTVQSLRPDLPNNDDGTFTKVAKYAVGLLLTIVSFVVFFPLTFWAHKEVLTQRAEEKALAHHNKTVAAAEDAAKAAHAAGRNEIVNILDEKADVVMDEHAQEEVLNKAGKTAEEIATMKKDGTLYAEAQKAAKGDYTLLGKTESKFALYEVGYKAKVEETVKETVKQKDEVIAKTQTELKVEQDKVKNAVARIEAANNGWISTLTFGLLTAKA